MKPMTLEPGEGAVPHRVFDLSIKDVNERRAKAQVFPTGQHVINYLGVSNTKFYNNREPGKRIFSKKHNKAFAVRIIHKEQIA